MKMKSMQENLPNNKWQHNKMKCLKKMLVMKWKHKMMVKNLKIQNMCYHLCKNCCQNTLQENGVMPNSEFKTVKHYVLSVMMQKH